MASSLSGAEAYFATDNHILAPTWAAFEESVKRAALAQAKRDLSRMAHVANIEAEIAVDMADGVNPEYAIYEQALWMLRNLPRANADASFPVAEATDPETESNARKAQRATFAPEALRWLIHGGAITLSRG
jgi:hypothetical protein